MNNNTLILVIGFLGALLIGAFISITLLVPGDKTIAYVGLGVVAGLFMPQLMTMKSSIDNAAKLEKVDKKIEENTIVTDKTHVLVNSRVSQLIKTVEQLSSTQQKLVAAQSLAAGITEGRAQVTQEVAPAGSTPPHGHPVAPKEKVKRPGPGDQQ